MLHELQRDFASALFAPRGAAVLDRIVADGLDPARRLFVHYNTIAAALTRVLENAYPALRVRLGPDAFSRAAAQHIRESPPGTAALLDYGDGFGAAAAAISDADDAALIQDIAAIEWAQKRAFHAADVPVVTRAELSKVAPGRLPALRFERHPALHLIRTTTDALAAWRAALGMPLGMSGEGTDRDVAVCRPDTQVRVHGLRPGSHALVAALADGATLEDAAQIAAAADPDIDLTSAIGEAVDLGAFTAFHA